MERDQSEERLSKLTQKQPCNILALRMQLGKHPRSGDITRRGKFKMEVLLCQN